MKAKSLFFSTMLLAVFALAACQPADTTTPADDTMMENTEPSMNDDVFLEEPIDDPVMMEDTTTENETMIEEEPAME